MSYPPQFFGSKEGILPVSLTKELKRVMVFYTTADNGLTWEQTTPLVPDLEMPEAWDFIDAYHGFVVDASNVYVTSDGAKSWTKHPLKDENFSGVRLDFVSPTTGFAIAQTQLYRTVDGGVTWEIIKSN